MDYDVIVIGGGSAGLMAAIAASGGGARTLLIDKGDKLGRKLGISGGGRCNVTNNKEMDELIKHIPGNGRFLYSAFASFGNKEIIAFFENLGIALKEEDNGRMFPVSDNAKTVVNALVGQVRKQGVDVLVNSPVDRVMYANGHVRGVRLRTGETIRSASVIVASGGKSVPHTGSEGDGYAWAEAAGHTITTLFPTEVPLTSKEPFIRSRELQGLSLRDVTLTMWNAKGKPVIWHTGDMLFTHFGLSGPIALRCSQFVVKELAKGSVTVRGDSGSAGLDGSGDAVRAENDDEARAESTRAVKADSGDIRTEEVLLTVDLFPGKSAGALLEETSALTKAEPKKAVKNVLKGLVQERLLPVLFRLAGLDEQTTHDNIPKANWTTLCGLLKAFPVRVSGTLSIEEAFVTGGGVHLKEIDPKTMESKLMQGLFFCGEVLDIHGYTGGYNITAAFSTGYSAGEHAALLAVGERQE